MSQLQTIENEIIKLTTLIAIEYPELYRYLEETPETVPSANHPTINIKVMEDYLESLNQFLKHHIETHKTK